MGWPCRLGKEQQALLRLLRPRLLFHSSGLLRVAGEAGEADMEVTDITATGPTVTQERPWEGHILCGTIFLDLLFPQNPPRAASGSVPHDWGQRGGQDGSGISRTL